MIASSPEITRKSITIFFDLDGPILDVSERYYRLHRDIVERFGGQVTDKATYWNHKRARQPLSTVLAVTGNGHIREEIYRAEWLQKIESLEYLQYDTILPGAREQLERLERRHRLILVTLRQRRDHLEMQLEQLRLIPFFIAVLSDSPTGADPAGRKRRLIFESGFVSKDTVVVGDTEIDIRAGRSLGLTTVAVLSGIRNREALTQEHPNQIVKDITELPEALLLESQEQGSIGCE